jgi:hypothetical protein
MTDIFKGATSNSLFLEFVGSTTGLPKTGIVYTDVTGSYSRSRGARVAITMATLASASAAYSSGGFILVDDTNQPGVYRCDVPDGAFATGAFEVVITLKAAGCRTVSRQVNLVDVNNQVAYAPNAAADAAGGLPISDAGGLDLDTLLARLDAAITTRMASYAQPTGFLAATFPATVGDATVANQSTIAGYIDTEVGAILTGLTSVVNDLNVGAGAGARTITVTVNDGAAALQNAIVRMTEGINTFASLTNASGVAVFNLDDATYAVSISKSGYSYAGTTLVVNGTEAATYSMTAIVITPAANPAQSTLSMTCYDELLAAEPGAIVTLQMVAVPTSDTGRSYDAKPITLTADNDGVIEVTVARLAKYKRTRGTGLSDVITIPDASTCTFISFLGREA